MGAKTAKRLAILVMTILVAGLSIFWIQRYQVKRMDQSVLDQAARAEAEENFEDAARFYQEHLELAPDDNWEVKLKRADALLKGPKDNARRQQAAQDYDQYVDRFPAEKKNVRRRLAELCVEMGQYSKARPHLEILLKSEPKDGALNFLIGRCHEAMNEPDRAMESYKTAITNGAPQRPEADARLAALLVQQNKVGDAEKVIETMVEDHPENYKVYLERGSYIRRFASTPAKRKPAQDDLQLARKMFPDDPRVYTELADLARSSNDLAAARQAIEAGLKVLPKEPTLHLERARLELAGSSGTIDQAITSLRHSLERLPDDLQLRFYLASLLAERRGDPAELLTQIGELNRLGLQPFLLRLLEAKNLINSREEKKAILVLTRLQQHEEQPAEMKAQVQDLLAFCYHQLGDPDHEREAYNSSVRANPKDVQAQFGLAESWLARNDIDAAIKVYRGLVDQFQRERREAELPPICDRLVPLLIARNQQRAAQPDWEEVDKLIDTVQKAAPQSSAWVILRTELLVAQKKTDEAQDLLEKQRKRNPRDLAVWLKSAELLRQQGKVDDARKLLDQVQQSLGDSVALRLERSRLLIVQRGPDLPKAFAALAENTASFSPADRRRLLELLAREAALLNDRTLLADLWSQVAKLAPDDLEPQSVLFDLALQGKNRAEIENRLNEIKRLEKADRSSGKLGDARYAIWQAANTTDPSEQAKLLGSAKSLFNELLLRDPVKPQVPRWLADLTLAELSQSDLSDDEKKQKQHDAAELYLKAIERGLRDLDTIRRATDLLYVTGHNDEVIQFWTQSPSARTASSELLRQVSIEAFRNQKYEGALGAALELARRAKAANPDDFRETRFLVQMLLANQRQEEAEKVYREAVNAAPSDPARRVALVEFFTLIKQMENADKAAVDAESALKDSPLGAAQCCEVLGRAYKTAVHDDRKSAEWLATAGRWYALALQLQPKDLDVFRQYIDFLARRASLSGKYDDWETARAPFQRFLEKSKNSNDPEILRRRPDYIERFTDELLKHYPNDQNRERLSEAQNCIKELKALRPDAFNVVALEARLYKAQNQMGKAIELIEATATRADLSDLALSLLAKLADDLGEPNLAEKLYRRLVAKSDRPQTRSALALFLARHGRVQEALDQYEPLWNATTNPDEELVRGTLKVIDDHHDKTYVNRCALWIEKALDKQPKSQRLAIALASLRELQGQFAESEALYAQVVQQGSTDPAALNNLAWLMTLLDGDEHKALVLINRAIERVGLNPELLDTRGVIYTKLGNNKNAIEDLTRATTLDPKGPKYFHLAQALLQAKDVPAATRYMEKARAQGLKPEGLHALEVKAYQELIAKLGSP